MKLLNPESLPKSPTMSWGVVAGGMIYSAGIVSMDSGGTPIHAGDAEAQANRILDIVEAILAEAGASKENIVKMICFAVTTDAARGYVGARKARFPGHPAATTVICSELLHPDYLLEVEFIAQVPGTGD